MNNRKSIVFFLLAIAALVGWNVCMRRNARDFAVRPSARRSLVDLPERVSSLEIERRGQPKIVLQQKDGWRLVHPYVGSADREGIVRLLDKLAFSDLADVIPDSELLRNGRARSDFSLTEPPVRVVVSADSRTEIVSFGSPTPSADGIYAAVEGVDAVFVVPSEVLSEVDRPADSFRQRSILGEGTDLVKTIDIKRGTGSILSFVYGADGWKSGDKRASEQRIRKYLADLSSAVVSDFVWPVGASNETTQASEALLAGYGLEPESAVTVILKDADGTSRQVSFGRDAGEGRVYAFVQQGSAIGTVPADLRETAQQDQLMFADLRLFPVDEKSVSSFSITEGDVVYALVRNATGGWSLESPIVAAADTAFVDEMLKRALALSPADVADSGILVTVATNVAPVIVAREAVLGTNGVESFRSLEMLRVDPLLVKRLSRTVAGHDASPLSVVFSRDRKQWSVEAGADATPDAKGIASAVAALSPLKAVKVVKLKVSAGELDDYGLNRPFLRLAVDQDREDAVRRNILVGRRTQGGRFATIGSADAVFVISDETVRALTVSLVEK